MEKNSFQKFVGWASIISAVLFVISIVGMQVYLRASLVDVNAFTENMVDNHGMMILYGWPGLLGTILIIPLVYFLNSTSDQFKELSKFVYTLTLIGLTFIMVGYLFHLSMTFFAAPLYLDYTEGGSDTSAQDYFFRALVGLQDLFWLSGDLFSFLGIALLLVFNWNNRIFPRWFLIVGMIAGISAALGSFAFIPSYKHITVLSLSFIWGFTIFAIWEIVGGYYLIRMNHSTN